MISKLDQMLIHRPARWLHQKDVHAANVFQQLKINFAIGKTLQLGLAQRHADELADLLASARLADPQKILKRLSSLSFGERFRSGALSGSIGLDESVECLGADWELVIALLSLP